MTDFFFQQEITTVAPFCERQSAASLDADGSGRQQASRGVEFERSDSRPPTAPAIMHANETRQTRVDETTQTFRGSDFRRSLPLTTNLFIM